MCLVSTIATVRAILTFCCIYYYYYIYYYYCNSKPTSWFNPKEIIRWFYWYMFSASFVSRMVMKSGFSFPLPLSREFLTTSVAETDLSSWPGPLCSGNWEYSFPLTKPAERCLLPSNAKEQECHVKRPNSWEWSRTRGWRRGRVAQFKLWTF